MQKIKRRSAGRTGGQPREERTSRERCARGRDRHTRKFANAPLNMISAAATPANKTEHEGRLTRRSWRQPDSFLPRFVDVTGQAELKGTETVLVVAEESPLRSAEAVLLRKLAYRVREAADAAAAQHR